MVGRRSLPRICAVAAAIALFAGCGGTPPLEAGDGEYALASDIRPYTWSAVVREISPGLQLDPGGSWSATFDLEADLRDHDERHGRFTALLVALHAQRRHDEDGHYEAGDRTAALTSRFSTTGMPIERFDGWPALRLVHGRGGSPFEGVARFDLSADDVADLHRISGTLEVQLPPDTPEGHYEPRLLVYVELEGAAEPVLLENFGDNSNTPDEQVLPLVRVGDPAVPRLPMTLFGDRQYRGQSGLLPREDRGHVSLAARSGFPHVHVLPPGSYDLTPDLPSLFPERAMAAVDGGLEVFPPSVRHHLDLASTEISGRIRGPRGTVELGSFRPFVDGAQGELETPGHQRTGPSADLGQTGRYEIELTARLFDREGRVFEGGGTYEVYSAWPLTFSTSCKPGTSFLVGDGYPPKVNLVPPVPAEVQVEVEYFPDSDPARKVTWSSSGEASRFGHYSPVDLENLVFDEPGEYVSVVTARYTDAQGQLWMEQQTSAGVVAPREQGTIRLHGTRTLPYNLKPDQDYLGGVQRFEDRPDVSTPILPFKPAPLPDVFTPYHPGDTLFLPSNGYNESIVEPHLSIAVEEPDLRARMLAAHRLATVLPPPLLQLGSGPWEVLEDVVQVSADSAAWFPADEEHADELPILPIGDEGWNAFAYPDRAKVEAYVTLGVVRPGFPVMTATMQSEALGLYWLASPNRFGNHFNAGTNGDLPGDLYRVQAGAVLKDRTTGHNHYDAYASSIVVIPTDGEATAILPPGARPLAIEPGREHWIHLALDTHDALELGEPIRLGGMVFPAVEADATWTVTSPSGREITLEGRANRLGIVRADRAIVTDEVGVYTVDVEVAWEELRGDVLGTPDGRFWISVVPNDAPPVLATSLPVVTWIDPADTVEIPLTWPANLRDVRIHWATLMPGRVLDQGIVEISDRDWTLRFSPAQAAAQHPNYDARNYATGDPELADTVVFQLHLEARGPDGPVHDSLRLALRGTALLHFRELRAQGMPAAHPPAGTQTPPRDHGQRGGHGY